MAEEVGIVNVRATVTTRDVPPTVVRATPIIGPTDRTVTLPTLGIILLPCPNEGPGEQCDGCDARCLLAEFLRREGEE